MSQDMRCAAVSGVTEHQRSGAPANLDDGSDEAVLEQRKNEIIADMGEQVRRDFDDIEELTFPLNPPRVIGKLVKLDVLEIVREALQEYACAGMGKCEMYNPDRCMEEACGKLCGESARKALALLPKPASAD